MHGVPVSTALPTQRRSRAARAGLHERLTAGATVADVGCGYGLALSILAAAYPASTFHGFDTSKTSLAKAAEATSGLDNVALFDPSADGGAMAVGAYDWILTLDAVHDMTRPAEVLKTVRRRTRRCNVTVPGARVC